MLLITNKTFSLPLLAAAFALLFTACDDSSTGPETGEEESQIETHTVEDLDTGYGGRMTPNDTLYYSLRENSIVDKSDSVSTQWDLAFSGTTIYTNSEASGPGDGGAIVLGQTFDATTIAPSEGYAIDTTATNLAITTGSDNGWYHYTGQKGTPPHTIVPLENTTLIVRTADGKHYAKLRIISWYKGNPDLSSDEFANNSDNYPSGNYTFEYAIQLNGTRTFTEE
ncbi:HmuY family protein [Fodinibius salsisoli]|uniref:HmuY family protein n=1 Tax=Fodinibius salsisoli TaxID=2820877 RepID=A0ABT3PNV3_9BACT|nr:HmuY family protein [Fodinibius salsisoli]MCW9707546.1 HmuY family protein [Fodinibius salsisoli]